MGAQHRSAASPAAEELAKVRSLAQILALIRRSQ